MPIIKSAKKRVRVARKAAIRNTKVKRTLKVAIKNLGAKPSADTHSKAQSSVDIALKKKLISKSKAARLKKRAAAVSKQAKVKLTPAKSTLKKPATKPASPKKKPAAKPKKA
ncbi:MAG: 30S ribosomal protein S20 [Candidatus Saccharimonadales bacterium]